MYLLTAAEQAALGPGYNGLMWRPGTTGARLHDYEDLPFTRWRQEIPQAIGWLNDIPGDSEAPALDRTSRSAPSRGRRARLRADRLAQRPAVANLVWNGSFEEDSSVVRWTTVLRHPRDRVGHERADRREGQIRLPLRRGHDRQRRGRQRRLDPHLRPLQARHHLHREGWVRRDAAGTGPNIRVKLGWGTGDIATGSNVSLSTDWQGCPSRVARGRPGERRRSRSPTRPPRPWCSASMARSSTRAVRRQRPLAAPDVRAGAGWPRSA